MWPISSIFGLTKRQPSVVSYIVVLPVGKERSGFGTAHGARLIDSTSTRRRRPRPASRRGRPGRRRQPGTAQPVDGDARDLLRETGQEQAHPGDVAVVLAGLVGAAEVDVLDLRGGTLVRSARASRTRRQVVGTDGAQGAAVAADRGADRPRSGFFGPAVAHASPLILGFGFLAPLPEAP